jgi:hypothetical protein
MTDEWRRRASVVFAAAWASLAGAGCASKSVTGSTYANGDSSAVIQFQSGGKADVSVGGVPKGCTYEQHSSNVTIDCEGAPTVLTVNEDGSLEGPPGSSIGLLSNKGS